MNPGPNPANFLLGDPVLNCVNGSTFYYVQIFATANPAEHPLAAVALSTSTDGGATFADPMAVVAKDAFTHFLDKNWFAVDPSDPKKLFVTYTDFDVSGTICGFDPSGTPIQRVAIELVRSTNGGASFGAPVVIAELCSPAPNFPFLQGSQVAVGPGGEVYVAWESFLNFNLARQIDIRKSLNHGASFNSPVKIDNVTCVGDCFALEGGFRTFLDLQGLAVDKSGTSTNGNVYVTWHDGRNFRVPDGESPNGVYGYADALISRSSNGGASWSRAVRVKALRAGPTKWKLSVLEPAWSPRRRAFLRDMTLLSKRSDSQGLARVPCVAFVNFVVPACRPFATRLVFALSRKQAAGNRKQERSSKIYRSIFRGDGSAELRCSNARAISTPLA